MAHKRVFIYLFKLANLALKNCSKFHSLFFIKILVSIFKTIIDFISRIFIKVFLNCEYIFNIFKNEFLVLCIVYTIFTSVTNLYVIYF